MSFELKKINDVTVKPVKPLSEPDPRPVLGNELFSECNASIFICASRGSGKTSVVAKILKECAGKNTEIIIFCANLDKDKAWIALQDYLERNGYNYRGHTSIFDPETGEDLLDSLNTEIKERAREELEASRKEESGETVDEAGRPITGTKSLQELMAKMFGPRDSIPRAPYDDDDNTPGGAGRAKLPRKSKYREPEYLVIFDDLSDEIKNNAKVARLLKNGRHFCKVIISSQYVKDLKPEARSNIDYWVLFKGLTEDTLKTVFRNAKLSITYEQFKKLYDHATSKKYQFLYVDSRENKFRQNFNLEYRET